MSPEPTGRQLAEAPLALALSTTLEKGSLGRYSFAAKQLTTGWHGMKAADVAGREEPAREVEGPAAAEVEGYPRAGRGLPWIYAGLVAVSVVIILIWAWLATVHVDDRYRIDQVSGVHMALAWDANHGVLYPPLYDGRTYGGTRYMPVPILLDALAARVTGNYLLSGKLLSYGYFVALLALMVVLLRRFRTPWALVVGLVALVISTETAYAASMNARSDALPVLLQVGAVGLVARSRRSSIVVAAAGLASLAFVTKLTAVWGPIAIALWLLVEERKSFVRFAAAYLGFTGALVAVFAFATHGRLFTNVFGLSTAGINGLGPLIRSPYRFFFEAIPHALAGWILVPIVGVAVWLAVRERRVSIWLLSLGAYVVVLMVMFADRGVGWNQLIDLVVLSALVVGELAGRATHYPRVGAVAIGVLAGTVLWANVTGLALLFGPEIKQTRDPAFQQTLTPHPLAGRADASTRILAEDPYVPVSLDQQPVVLDPFMLITVGQRDPSAVQALVRRIDERGFDLVVLRVPLQDPSMAWWFRQEAFGATVADALRRNYVYSYWVAGYYVYVPRPAPGSA